MVADGQRRGLAARLNQAIELARGRYLARMDADDIAYPERLERQLAFLEAHPEVDLLGSGMMVFADDGHPAGLYNVRTTHAEICARPLSGFYLAHPTWMGRIDWFRKWRYDPVCRKAQDQDLLLRAWRSSRYAALPEPLVGYRQDAFSIRKSWLGRYYFSRAILRVSASEGRLPAASVPFSCRRPSWRWTRPRSGRGTASSAAQAPCAAVSECRGRALASRVGGLCRAVERNEHEANSTMPD